MPDPVRPGTRLTREQEAQIIEALKEKATVQPCPSCRRIQWELGSHPVYLVSTITADSRRGAEWDGYTCLVLTCLNCGYTQLHNMGILTPAMLEGEPGRSTEAWRRFLVVIDEDNRTFTIEGPMTSLEEMDPWIDAVSRAQDEGRRIHSHDAPSEISAARTQERLGFTLAPCGSIVQPAPA